MSLAVYSRSALRLKWPTLNLVKKLLLFNSIFYSLAIKQLSEVDGWSDEQMKAIIAKAKAVWTQTVDQWDKDQISELGKVLSKRHQFCSIVINIAPSSATYFAP